MEDNERFYILVPETVQPFRPFGCGDSEENPSYKMVPGRLIAQSYHIGRKIENTSLSDGYFPYEEITAITLSTRNTKELRKVSDEVKAWCQSLEEEILYEEFHDTNPDFYGTSVPVHTATAFGPVTREEVDHLIGHLELYGEND
jgi:hypothetical protein